MRARLFQAEAAMFHSWFGYGFPELSRGMSDVNSRILEQNPT